MISHWLYETKDAEKLTLEQKDTITAITRALGSGVGAAVGGSSANAMQGSLNADSAVGNNALDISSTDTFGKNRGGKKEEKPEATAFQKILQAIMPAHVAGVTKNKEDKDALMAIASLRNNVTGPIVLTGISATYGGSTLVQLTPAVANSLFNFCLGNPIACNNAGIVVAEMGAGVSLGNPATAIRGTAGKVTKDIANPRTYTQKGTIVVYRVEGSTNQRLIIGDKGEISLYPNKKQIIWLNFEDKQRAN